MTNDKTVNMSAAQTGEPAGNTYSSNGASTAGASHTDPNTLAEGEDKWGKTRIQQFIAEWFPYFIFFTVVLLFRITILINAVIPTESMVATIQKGDHVIGLKSSYWFSEPQRGDIVVFHAPDTPETLYIKRVIGTPGDTVVISDGKTYINGEQLQEDYLPEPMEGYFGPFVVPEGSWFMLGDNRNHSLDARYWDNTWVTKDMIVGKAYFRYWPPVKWLY